MKYSTVFIDIDDTLIDTAGNTLQTLDEIYADYNLSQYFDSFNNFLSIFQANNTRIWKQYEQNLLSKDELLRNRFLVPLRDVNELSEEEVLRMNDDYIGRIINKNNLVEGAVGLLDYLHAKYKICAVSNGFTEMQFRKIESAGLSAYFDEIILSDSVGINKPHPDIFNYAMQMAGVLKDRVVMIGDNYSSDITGAYNSGIDQIWYNPKDKPADDFEPTFVVKSLFEIKSIL